MSVRVAALLLALLACQWGPVHARVAPKGVTASLTAKWPPTPLLHEAAEFLVRVLQPPGAFQRCP